MSRKKISHESIVFVTDTVFNIARAFMKKDSKAMPDLQVNSMVVNVTMSQGNITTMFLEGHEYLMTVDKNALIAIN